MTAVLHLDQLLRETVAVPSRNLVTRPTGAAVRDRVLLWLREQQGEAHLDFSQVGVVDFSCADEVVAKLLAVMDSLPVARVLLRGVHPHHADAIDHALGRQGLTVLALLDDRDTPCLLGLVSEDARQLFEALRVLGRAPEEEIAAFLAWPPARAREALADLTRRGCVRCHSDASFDLGIAP